MELARHQQIAQAVTGIRCILKSACHSGVFILTTVSEPQMRTMPATLATTDTRFPMHRSACEFRV